MNNEPKHHVTFSTEVSDQEKALVDLFFSVTFELLYISAHTYENIKELRPDP